MSILFVKCDLRRAVISAARRALRDRVAAGGGFIERGEGFSVRPIRLAAELEPPYVERMGEDPNPLIPAPYDIVWTIVTIAAFTLMIVALVSIARASKRLTPMLALIWTLVALFVPVVGPIAWLVIGRSAADATEQLAER